MWQFPPWKKVLTRYLVGNKLLAMTSDPRQSNSQVFVEQSQTCTIKEILRPSVTWFLALIEHHGSHPHQGAIGGRGTSWTPSNIEAKHHLRRLMSTFLSNLCRDTVLLRRKPDSARTGRERIQWRSPQDTSYSFRSGTNVDR